MNSENHYADNHKNQKEKKDNKKIDFWNFLTDFRFYIGLIVIIIWILKVSGLIFNH